jgi:hypothetical protein
MDMDFVDIADALNVWLHFRCIGPKWPPWRYWTKFILAEPREGRPVVYLAKPHIFSETYSVACTRFRGTIRTRLIHPYLIWLPTANVLCSSETTLTLDDGTQLASEKFQWGMPITLANGTRFRWPVRFGYTNSLVSDAGEILVTVRKSGLEKYVCLKKHVEGVDAALAFITHRFVSSDV